MATIGNGAMTLLDMATLYNGKEIVPVIEVLAKENQILADIPWIESNSIYGHRFNQQASLPAGSWRKLNEGVAREKGTSKPVIRAAGSLEAYSLVDADIIDGSPNPAFTRQQNDMPFLEGLSQTFATALFYGNTTTAPEQIDGIGQYISTLSSTDARGVANVIGASGTGSDVTSIYVIQWGAGRVQMFYPLGTTAGLQMEDLGRMQVNDSDGNPYMAYQTRFAWKAGLAIQNDRCIQRIANIESAGSSNTFDQDDLITAINRLPNGGAGAVIYCNSTIKTQMDILAAAKTNVSYTSAEVFGRPTTLFRGVPVRVCDSILNTETAIS